jgi:uncharacterized lipoprotein YmbA
MKRISLILVATILAGCASTATLERSIQSRTGALMYVYDSEEVSKKDRSLVISSFVVDDLFDRSTIVRRKTTFVLPLIVFNMWRQEDDVQLGYSQLKSDYKQFLRGSLIEEIKRSSKYVLTDERPDVSLEVRVRKLEMAAPINQRGLFLFPVFFWFYQSQMSEGPANVTITADIRASKAQAVVLTREVRGTFRTNVLAGKGALLPEYTTAVMQAVSMAAKDLNEQIVAELNGV